MDMGPEINVGMGSSVSSRWGPDARAGAAPVGAMVAPSATSSEHLAFEAEKLIDDIRMALSSDLSVATKKAASLSLLLATKVARYQRPGPARGGLAAWQKNKVQNYIKNRLDEPLPIEELAKLVALSASYFCRAFKDSFGEPPHAYVIRMRVKHAQTLMMSTSESLGQIALACGLVDQSHLCRCFRQITGDTPGAWRRRNAPDPTLTSVRRGCFDDLVVARTYSQRGALAGLQL